MTALQRNVHRRLPSGAHLSPPHVSYIDSSHWFSDQWFHLCHSLAFLVRSRIKIVNSSPLSFGRLGKIKFFRNVGDTILFNVAWPLQFRGADFGPVSTLRFPLAALGALAVWTGVVLTALIRLFYVAMAFPWVITSLEIQFVVRTPRGVVQRSHIQWSAAVPTIVSLAHSSDPGWIIMTSRPIATPFLHVNSRWLTSGSPTFLCPSTACPKRASSI